MVVVFTDGNIGNIQALYLLLSRQDISVEGIIVNSGICSIDIGISNILQLLMLMEKYTVRIYRGEDSGEYISNVPNLESCSDINIFPLEGEYNIESHISLMNQYKGDAISLAPFSIVAEWIENGSITHLTAFIGSMDPMEIGYYIYAIDPQAYNYVLSTDIPKELLSTDMINQYLPRALRGIVLSNTVLRSISETVLPIILEGNWRFWDMILMMEYLQYI